MTESFNNWIGSVRGMPIVRMLEEIRRKIMILIQKRHELGKTWHDELPPLVRRRLIDARVESDHYLLYLGTIIHLKSWKMSLGGVLWI